MKHRSPACAVRPSLPSWVQWLFSASKGTVWGVNDGFRFGSSGGTTLLVPEGYLFSVELGAKFGLLEQLLAACSEHVAPQRLGFQSERGRHAWLSSPQQWFAHLLLLCEFANSGIMSGSGWPASIPNSSCCSTLVTSWTMLVLRIKVRNVWCFSRSLAVARMVIWETQNKRLYDGANFSHRDLIQLRVKIRCNKKNAWIAC